MILLKQQDKSMKEPLSLKETTANYKGLRLKLESELKIFHERYNTEGSLSGQ